MRGDYVACIADPRQYKVAGAVRIYKRALSDDEYNLLERLETALANEKPIARWCNPSTKTFEYDVNGGLTFNGADNWVLYNPYSVAFEDDVLFYASRAVQDIANNLIRHYKQIDD